MRPNFETMGISIGCDTFAALRTENRMLVHRSRSKRKTTFSHHRFFKYPNLIRDCTPSAPNQRWANDILKTEWPDKRPLRNGSEAYVEQIIGLYNSRRPHQNLVGRLCANCKVFSEQVNVELWRVAVSDTAHHDRKGPIRLFEWYGA